MGELLVQHWFSKRLVIYERFTGDLMTSNFMKWTQ
ncbi:hypothetical protein O77CONTIG1_03225 [Leptolyngbya sp. O-77]|nr:hypothetical protein O77CONTIG1_03225 [Leptolyngbya sp. O-77]